MTPLEIEILLHYYTRPGEYRGGDFGASSVMEAMNKFTGPLRLLEVSVSSSGPMLVLSSRGKAFVKRLLYIEPDPDYKPA